MKNSAELLYRVLEARHPVSPLFIFEEGKLIWQNNAAKRLFGPPKDTPHVVGSVAAGNGRTIEWTQPSSGKRWRISAIPIRSERSFHSEAIDAVSILMEEVSSVTDDFQIRLKTWSEIAAAWEVSHAMGTEDTGAWNAFREIVAARQPKLTPMRFSEQLMMLRDNLGKLPFSSSIGQRLEWKTWDSIDDVWIESEPAYLAPAIEEIIRNALETEVGTVLLQAGAAASGDRCELKVLHRHHGEKGNPIWPPRAGEPFITTKPGHFGLGLVRARILTHQQRGHLSWAISPYGTLTTFSFLATAQKISRSPKVRASAVSQSARKTSRAKTFPATNGA